MNAISNHNFGIGVDEFCNFTRIRSLDIFVPQAKFLKNSLIPPVQFKHPSLITQRRLVMSSQYICDVRFQTVREQWWF